jgi:hypothetical protein
MRQMPVALIAVITLEVGQLLHAKTSVRSLLGNVPLVVRWGLYAGFVMAVVMFGIYQKAQFIYFQF